MIDSTDIDKLSTVGLQKFLSNQQIEFDTNDHAELHDLCLFYILSSPSRDTLISNELSVAFPQLIEVISLLL